MQEESGGQKSHKKHFPLQKVQLGTVGLLWAMGWG